MHTGCTRAAKDAPSVPNFPEITPFGCILAADRLLSGCIVHPFEKKYASVLFLVFVPESHIMAVPPLPDDYQREGGYPAVIKPEKLEFETCICFKV